MDNCTSGARSPCRSCKHSQACSEDAYSASQTFAACRWPGSDPYKACIALCAAAMLPMLRPMPSTESPQAAEGCTAALCATCCMLLTMSVHAMGDRSHLLRICCASSFDFWFGQPNLLSDVTTPHALHAELCMTAPVIHCNPAYTAKRNPCCTVVLFTVSNGSVSVVASFNNTP